MGYHMRVKLNKLQLYKLTLDESQKMFSVKKKKKGLRNIYSDSIMYEIQQQPKQIALFEAIFIWRKIKKSKGIVKMFRMLVNSDTKQNKRIGWRGAHSQEC